MSFYITGILWNLDRYTLLNIPPRRVEDYELALDEKQFRELRGRLLLLPISIAVLGWYVIGHDAIESYLV